MFGGARCRHIPNTSGRFFGLRSPDPLCIRSFGSRCPSISVFCRNIDGNAGFGMVSDKWGIEFLGCGGEDDDIYERLRVTGKLTKNLRPRRPQRRHGLFISKSHESRREPSTPEAVEMFMKGSEYLSFWNSRGLNTLKYFPAFDFQS